jgi:hypothetical protein
MPCALFAPHSLYCVAVTKKKLNNTASFATLFATMSSRRLMEAVSQIKELDTVKKVHEGGDDRSSICHNCAKEDSDNPMPMQCARCKLVWYCSVKCMTSAAAEHVKICGKSKDLDVSAHTKLSFFDYLPDGRRLSELLRLKQKREELQPLSIEELEAEPGLYQIPDMADGGSSIEVSAVDERGHKFQPVTAGTLFRYRESEQHGASWVEKKKNARLGDVYCFHGNGQLTITFTSKKGSKQTIQLSPRKPTPPTLEIERLANGVMRVATSADCIGVKCKDSQGNKFKKALAPGSLFRYEKATATPKAKSVTDGDATIKLIEGLGDLTITASESSGLTTTVTVSPS